MVARGAGGQDQNPSWFLYGSWQTSGSMQSRYKRDEGSSLAWDAHLTHFTCWILHSPVISSNTPPKIQAPALSQLTPGCSKVPRFYIQSPKVTEFLFDPQMNKLLFYVSITAKQAIMEISFKSKNDRTISVPSKASNLNSSYKLEWTHMFNKKEHCVFLCPSIC